MDCSTPGLPIITNSRSLHKLMSSESVIPSNHLILYHPLLLLPSLFPASGSFLVSQFFASGGQSIGVSAIVMVFAIHWHELATGIYVAPPSWISPHLLPTLSLYVVTEIQLWGALCHTSNSNWLSILYTVTYTLQHSSLKSSHSPSPTEFKSLLFIALSPLLPCMSDRQYHLSRFHIYALIRGICLFLSDLLHSV